MLHLLRSKVLLFGERLIERGAWFLAPLSYLFGFCSLCKNFLHDRGWLPSTSLPKTVVSVGNLVAGGTGKTPLVLLLAERLSSYPLAILSRGYGALPDEALLLKRRCPFAKIYVGKDRVALAKRAIREGAELLLLDDGFQYRKLRRNFDLVLLSASDPFGKGHYLPWGFLRDSPKRLAAADALFVSGSGNIALCKPSIRLESFAQRVLTFPGEAILSIEGWPVGLFCGIARPSRFKKTIEGLGASVAASWILADHERVSPSRLLSFAKRCKHLGAKALICTEKDRVKIDSALSLELPLLFVEISSKVVEGGEEWEKLIAKIEKNIHNLRTHDTGSKNCFAKARREHCQRDRRPLV